MGNWRTVYITGTCPEDEVQRLTDALYGGSGYENFGPLCWMDNPGLCGLGKWPAAKIMRVGNLAERDYSVDQVAEHLTKAVELSNATGLDIKIHCGDDNEKDNCIATIVCKDGKVETFKPEIETIPDIPDKQIRSNLYDVILGGGKKF